MAEQTDGTPAVEAGTPATTNDQAAAPAAAEAKPAPVEAKPATPPEDKPNEQAAAAPANKAGEVEPAEKPGAWPEDWRTRSARGDEKRVKRLERYASPEAAIDALIAAQDKIASGSLKTALKPDATPEELKAWRADNGIPEDPKGYDLSLPNGLVIGDNDKPFVEDFLKVAHDSNYKPEEVKSALAWFFNKQEEGKAQQLQAIANRVKETEDILREEYGTDYRKNIQIANNLVASAPPEVQRELTQAYLPDGTLLGDSPHFARWAVALGRELNPIGSVVPGSGTNAVQAVETEMSGLRKMMGDTESEYWKGPKAAKNQARYLELVQAMEKGKGR